MSFLFNNQIEWDTDFTSQTVDASGRARTATPFIDFSAEFPFDKDLARWDEQLIGTGTSTHDADASRVVLDVGTNSGDRVTRQTKEYFRYQPGVASTITLAFLFSAGEAGNVKRVGLGDDVNGLFYELNGTTSRFVRRTSATGTLNTVAVDQTNWNVDQLDGNGPSGYTLDITKIQRVIIGFDWYGSGIIKFGFHIDGRQIICHVFQVANTLAESSIGKPILPIRYEVENVAATTNGHTIYQYGSSVVREGGSTLVGLERNFSNGVTSRSVSSSAFLPVLSIRLKTNYIRAQIIPRTFSVFSASNTNIYFELVINPTLTSPSWVSASNAVEGDVSATAVSGGTVIASGYTSRNTSQTPEFTDVDLRLGADINGVADIVTIRAQALSTSADTLASISWKELD